MAAYRSAPERETQVALNRLQGRTGTSSKKGARGCGVTLAKATGAAQLLSMSLLLLSTSAHAQKKGDKVRVLAGSAMRAAPGGQVVGILSRAFEGPVEMVEGNAVRLRLNGFVNEATVRLEANRTRGVVAGKGDEGATLRTGPAEKEASLATLMRGAVVFTGARSGAFLPANRVVWIDKSRLASYSGPAKTAAAPKPVPPAAGKPGAPKPVAPLPSRVASADSQPQARPAPQPHLPPSGLPPMQLMTGSPLRVAPSGDVISTIPSGTIVTPLTSENGWTRVRVEGWLPNKDLVDASAKAAGELSAAEVRADPAGTKGRTVRWTVEALSYQTGDDLRRELTGAPYLLARGPGNERAIIYLAVPDSLVATARALAPLTTVTVTAKVRNGRSQPGGVPILDLVELIRR